MLNTINVKDDHPILCLNRPVKPRQNQVYNITSHHELYTFLLMTYGLNSTPRTFQGVMDLILLTVRLQSAIVHLEDIDIFSQSVSDHTSLLHSALDLLLDYRVSFKVEECFFFDEEIDYIKHVLKKGKLAIFDEATDGFRGLKQQTTLRDLKSFLSFCNMFSWFPQNLAQPLAPLNKKLVKDHLFHFHGLGRI